MRWFLVKYCFSSRLCISDLRSVFELFDTNRDGTICVKELLKLMQSCGQNPTQKDVEEIMKAVDKNGKVFFIFF